jgi:hypothetical protein
MKTSALVTQGLVVRKMYAQVHSGAHGGTRTRRPSGNCLGRRSAVRFQIGCVCQFHHVRLGASQGDGDSRRPGRSAPYYYGGTSIVITVLSLDRT